MGNQESEGPWLRAVTASRGNKEMREQAARVAKSQGRREPRKKKQ
jgi:hypothetical protein